MTARRMSSDECMDKAQQWLEQAEVAYQQADTSRCANAQELARGWLDLAKAKRYLADR